MSIRNFEDIHSIRKELRKIQSDCVSNEKSLSSLRRIIISSRMKVLSAYDKSFSTREDYSKIPKETKPQKLALDSLEKLTNLLSDVEDKNQLAEHIHQLLNTHFSSEDGAVIKKLTALSKELVDTTKQQRNKIDQALKEQGEKVTPLSFKNIIKDIKSRLLGEFDTASEKIETKYYSAVDTIAIGDRPAKRLLNIAFITINGFEANGNVRDLVITITRRTDSTNHTKDYVRTFTHQVSPANLVKNNLGVEFNDNARAMQVIMRALQVDNVLDVIEPSQIPIKKRDIKFKNPNIKTSNIDEDNGVITFYLNTDIQDEAKANKVLQDIFVETKAIIKSIHPRNRNAVKATPPRMRKINVKGDNSATQQYYFKIMFSKPDNSAAIELPRDKIKKFMQIMDIESPESAKEFNVLLKRFLGVSAPAVGATPKAISPLNTNKSAKASPLKPVAVKTQPAEKAKQVKHVIQDEEEEDEVEVPKRSTNKVSKTTSKPSKPVKTNRFLNRRPMT
jgi:hypothetical protein